MRPNLEIIKPEDLKTKDASAQNNLPQDGKVVKNLSSNI